MSVILQLSIIPLVSIYFRRFLFFSFFRSRHLVLMELKGSGSQMKRRERERERTSK